ncbi:BREX-1 system adenine-specific DNA-methyltransferase PglX [Prauserella alba]|uniref:site-specific DNA-methyltransferase (adenine-specific) n=1 Tax=Prauserella alba TaxID=176898 RepID=A0ABN1V231_9PSEU|nr:BREX-1 system adenine-specific DNA-methyltransferase PglX [Prauserella alba]MCP2178862.1 Methyltransferase domain-containing protein [Prauserella alba]
MSSRTSGRGGRSHAPDSAQQHRDWLNLIEVSGPFLSLPVLRKAWPSLDALDKTAREGLRQAHADWLADPDAGQQVWIRYVLGELLGWDGGQERALHWHSEDELDTLAMDVGEHDTRVVPDFALVRPGEDAKPATTELLGMVCPTGSPPTARVKGESWAATPVDRLAQLCRHHEVELGLATDGRWWTLVWAPRRKVTTTATFDAASWPEKSEEYVVRAFVSLLNRQRFFGVPDDEKLVTLLDASKDSQEDITEALGVQVRQAVELLVAAIGRADTAQRGRGEQGLDNVEAHEVYRGAVSVMMRLVFVLFAEERGLLPADNELYAHAYSAGRLCEVLEQQAREGSEDDLEHSSQRWHRLLALFDAVYHGVEHPKLTMHAHDGSLFDPGQFAWLPRTIDDRTVLHMLRAVQYVQVGTGKNKELRRLSFRELDVEQIGYVYEGLLAYDGFRAGDVVLGLIGKAGVEKEVGLRELENLAAGADDVSGLAKKLAEEYKDYKVGTPKALEKALAPLSGTELENARRKLLAATDGDAALTERLLPFYGVIRQDLRELPVVIMPGELYVTDSPLRKNTGTHYTPRELAEEVVEGALEPLVYEPGPLQTADRTEWKLKSSAEILSLKIADIAMGSAAFLVAAARYLGGKLLEAWTREGDDRVLDYQASTPISDADVDPVVVEARREIIEHCLYGADINKMAVEMAKLSLWLVSMDPSRPFTFLDDRLVAGDSLLGITSLDQLEYMHMDPKKGRELHDRLDPQLLANVRSVVAEVAEDRRKLTEVDGSTLEGLNRKRAILEESALKTSRARIFADLAVGAALAHAGRGGRGLAAGSIAAADYARRFDTAEMEARKQAREWLDTDLPDGNLARETLHWPLAFPEVFEQDGFDAVIGNPPFLGGAKLRPTLGRSYREYLASAIANGVKGTNTDLIAYFSLRAHELLSTGGQSGLIATNTLAQGDTREVGLDQLLARGLTIRRSLNAAPWPSKSAALEYCIVWISCAPLGECAECVADGNVVSGINSSLDPFSRTSEKPNRLIRNTRIAFLGHHVNGMGFVMSHHEAQELVAQDRVSDEVVHPYLNGEDLNTSSNLASSRNIINFHDWDLDYADGYPAAMARVRKLVKPERDKRNREAHRKYWWQYADYRRSMVQATDGLDRVVVIAQTSQTAMPAMVSTDQVFSHALIVFAKDDMAMLALLSSASHHSWAIRYGSKLKSDFRYIPSDVFQTFPLPELTDELRELGEWLDGYRRDVMLSRDSGLTKTYNLVFDPSCHDEDIEELRRIHREIDKATIRAYGWEDRIEAVGGLDHGFHPVVRQARYTIGPAAQREILDSLLELNHERYAEEVAQGLHDKKKSKKAEEETLF